MMSAAASRSSGSASAIVASRLAASSSTRLPSSAASVTAALDRRVSIAVEHELGCAEDPRPLTVERRRAPLAGRRERHRARQRPVRRIGEPALQRRLRGVGVRVGPGDRGEGRLDLVASIVVEDVDVRHVHRPRRDRAGLVEADHVDAGQDLDRGKLLDERVAAWRDGPRRPRTRRSSSRMRPSGTIATTPPTADTRPSLIPSDESSWLMNSAIPVGTSSHVTTVTMRSMTARNSLCTSVKRRASAPAAPRRRRPRPWSPAPGRRRRRRSCPTAVPRRDASRRDRPHR